MQTAKRIVIIAGEESGDIHASKLIQQLKVTRPDLQISGIGGEHMSEAGVELISDLARHGVTGLTEVVRHFNTIRKAFYAIQAHLKTHKPDLLILVDYPGFNLRLAKYAKEQLGLKIIYYISPQIWAWKAKRIHLIKKYIDHMAVILPFEKNIYEQAGIAVDFVGHPLIKNTNASMSLDTCRVELNLPVQARVIALLPGSRTHEVERHMPVLRDTAQQLHQHNPHLHFVIPIARTIKPELIKAYFLSHQLPITFIEDKAVQCMAAADFVIVASGTASLECALLAKPMCIIYKSSLLTYVAARKLIKVKFLGLCNLLANKMLVPEFLQEDCNPNELSRYIIDFYTDPNKERHIIAELSKLKESMSTEKADRSLYRLVEDKLSETTP